MEIRSLTELLGSNRKKSQMTRRVPLPRNVRILVLSIKVHHVMDPKINRILLSK